MEESGRTHAQAGGGGGEASGKGKRAASGGGGLGEGKRGKQRKGMGSAGGSRQEGSGGELPGGWKWGWRMVAYEGRLLSVLIMLNFALLAL